MVTLRRGDLVLAELDPVVRPEQGKVRPCLVVTNDDSNAIVSATGQGMVALVPLTSNVDRVLPFQVLIPAADAGLARDSKAQTEQLRAVSVRRIVRSIGSVSRETLAVVDEALRIHLAL